MKRDLDPLIVAGVALLAYANNLGNGFTYDDVFIIERNPLVRELDWWGLASSSYWGDVVDAGLYRPLTLLSFGLNRAIGSSAFGFHLVNDLLHAGVSVLALVAARGLGANRFVALATGLLFALHPLHTEAVNAVVGRAEILAFGFVLGAFIVFVRGGRPVWVGALFFLALCSKESAAFAVALFALYRLLYERRNLIPIAVALAAYAVLRVAMLGSFGIAGREIGFLDNPIAHAPWSTRLVGAFILLTEYTALVLWPMTPSADYSFNQIPIAADGRVLAGMAIATTLGVVAWRKRGHAAFAALAFVVPLVGFLHLVFPLGTLFAERLTYMPLFGAAFLIALIVDAVPRRSWLLTVLLGLAAARVVTRNPDWHDNETLFRRTVETSPRSARSHFLLGAELSRQERYREAAAAFETGLAIAPQHVGARMSLGEARLQVDDAAGAVEAFEKALERTPSAEVRARTVEGLLVAGRTSARDGDFSAAKTYFTRARALSPQSVDATNSLGLVLEREGDVERAGQLYQEALSIDEGYVPAILNLASVRMATERLADAEELFRRAVSLAPDSYEAYNGLGIALARQGRSDAAEGAFRRAFEIDPSLDAAQDNLRALGKTP